MHPRLTDRRPARLAVVAALTAAFVSLSGCMVHEVTYTRNGVEVTPADLPDSVKDIDACEALSNQTRETLGIADVEPQKLVPPQEHGCEWVGVSNYTTPSVVLWVTEPAEGDPTEETVSINGVTVNVFGAWENTGRYIAYLDDVTLSVNYNGSVDRELVIDARTALETAMSDVLAHYGR